MGQGTGRLGHVHRDIVPRAPGHQVIVRRDTDRRTMATCHAMELDSGDDTRLITGAGITTLTTGGSGRPLLL
jgi:hypothetical protein